MTHGPESPLPGDAPRHPERPEIGRHHPVRRLEREAERLRDVAARGESAATPMILIGTWVVVVLPLVAIVVGLAFGVAYLITGSSGTSYPTAPTVTPTQAGAAAGQGDDSSLDLKAIPTAQNVATVIHRVTSRAGQMPSFETTPASRSRRSRPMPPRS